MFKISIAAARVNAQMTQAEAAKKMEVSRNTIVNWEAGKQVPDIAHFQMMCRIYNVPEERLIMPVKST